MTRGVDVNPGAEAEGQEYSPVRLRKSYEEVAARLERDILAGRLSPGTKLPAMQALAEQFGVSVPVVREALMALQARGLLDVRHGSGTYINEAPGTMLTLPLGIVVPLTSRHLVSLFDVRIPLEARSAQLAAVHRSDDDLARLRLAAEANRSYRDRGEWEEFFHSDAEFHLAIAAATANPFLPVMLEPLLDLIMTARASYYERGVIEKLLPRDLASDQHSTLVEAIAAGCPEEAGQAMEDHLLTFVRNVQAHERSRSEPEGNLN